MTQSPSSSFGSREERIAYNEAHRRGLNERKAERVRDGQPAAGFRCECGRLECFERIQLSDAQWEEARAEHVRFVVVPGHVAVDVETVVKEYPHAWLVEKRGRAGAVASELD